MNLAEALDVLPEITTVTRSRRTFRMDPRIVGREHIEEGKPIFLSHIPGSTNLFRLNPEQWKLVHLFDGQRSYEEIAELFLAETGIGLGTEDVRNFAETMDDADFWYQTPQEKNIALMQKLREGGVALIPLSLYFSNGKVKVELALGRGKKEYDKRQTLAKRDSDREIAKYAGRRAKCMT